MKRIHAFQRMCIAIVTAALPLAAQSVNVKASIPFDFVVGQRTMPAGEYTVASSAGAGAQSTDVLLIGSLGSGEHVYVTTQRMQTRDGNYPETSKLEFRRYGHRYFLNGVWTSASCAGHELPMSRTERELSRSATVKPQSVIVLAQGPSARNTADR